MKIIRHYQKLSFMGMAKTYIQEMEVENNMVRKEERYLFGFKYKDEVTSSPLTVIGFIRE